MRERPEAVPADLVAFLGVKEELVIRCKGRQAPTHGHRLCLNCRRTLQAIADKIQAETPST